MESQTNSKLLSKKRFIGFQKVSIENKTIMRLSETIEGKLNWHITGTFQKFDMMYR